MSKIQQQPVKKILNAVKKAVKRDDEDAKAKEARVIEAKTGLSVFDQLVMWAKMTGADVSVLDSFHQLNGPLY